MRGVARRPGTGAGLSGHRPESAGAVRLASRSPGGTGFAGAKPVRPPRSLTLRYPGNARGRLRLILGFILLVGLVTGCSSPDSTGRVLVPLPGRSLYLAPLDGFPRETADSLVTFYRDKYGVETTVLPSAAVDPRAWDEQRGQLVAEEVIASVKAEYADVVADSGAVIVALVERDIYLRERTDWAWAFGYRRDGRFAVVSTARMSWPAGLASDPRVSGRLRKMVTKNIGLMYFGLPASDDPQSVLYRNVGGLGDLDRMGEEF